MRSVRGTKQYWQKCGGELNALVRDFGPATVFLTLSCAEYSSPDILEFLQLLGDYCRDKKINNNISKMCTEDPVSVSKQFSHKFHALFQTVILRGQLFGEVVCYFIKKEYQDRGAPHYHVMLWIKDAPVIGVDPDHVVLSWIQERITCHIPDKNTDPELYALVTKYQMHKCNAYCTRRIKIGRGKYIKRCRFNFPRKATSTASVNPLDKSKTRQRVYDLPRKSEEARINDYNPLLLLLWKANVDVQYIAENSMALTGYITAYVTKAEKSAMQQEFADLASSGNLYSRLWKFAYNCFKNREVGLYEAPDR